MPFTLSKLLQGMYRELGQLNISKATGGSTTTVIDTTQSGRHKDDSWKDGTLVIVRDAGGLGAAPEEEFQRISAYSDVSSTFTVDTAFTAAPAAGDAYGWTSEYYPLQNMIQAANDGLRALGDIPLVDTTTLTTTESQTEYTAAVAWKRAKPYRVDIQTRTDDANDNQWVTLHRWDWVPAAAGSTGLIVLPIQPVSNRKLRVWYRDSHPVLNAYSDKVNEAIDPELAVLAGTEKALAWQNTRVSGSDTFLLQRLNDLRALLQRRLAETPIYRPKSKPKLMTLGVPEAYGILYGDDFNWPDA